MRSPWLTRCPVWATSPLTVTRPASIIASMLFKFGPDELRFIMVDPKVVEMASQYGNPKELLETFVE